MLHCNDIDPFVTLMGNFNWGPISRNDIVSRAKRPGAKRPGGETSRGGNGLGAKRPRPPCLR